MRAPALVSLLLLGSCGHPSAPETVLLVVLDGVPDAGFAASAEVTPYLARFAQAATRFDDHVAVSTGANAALASLVTGLPPWLHGLGSLHRRGRARLSEGFVTLAEQFQEAGYRTLAAVALPQFRADFSGLLQGFEETVEPPLDARARWTAPETWSHSRTALAERLESDEPVFAMFCFADTRTSARAARPTARILVERLGPFRDGDEVIDAALRKAAEDPARALADLEAHLGRGRGSAPFEALEAARRDGALADIDRCFGEMLDELARTGREPGASLCVVGLRGGTEGQAGQRTFRDSAVVTPLLLRLRGDRSARRIARTVQLRALARTLLEAQGLPSTPGPASTRLPGLGGAGPLGPAGALCVDTHLASGAGFHGDLRVELDDSGAPRVFRRADGAAVPSDELALERRAELETLGRMLARRLADPLWRVETTLAGDEALSLGWSFSDGLARRAQVVAENGARDLTAGATGQVARIEAASEVLLHGNRPDVPLRLRLASRALVDFDPARAFVGERSFAEVPVLWLPVARRVAPGPSGPPGPPENGRAPAEDAASALPRVDLEHESGAWWRLAVSAPQGEAVRVLMALFPPGPIDESLELDLGETQGLVEPVRGRLDAVWVTGSAPLSLRVKKEPDRQLALCAAVERRAIPPARLFAGGRAYAAGDELELYLPDWMPGVTDALDRGADAPLAAGALRISRADRARSKRLAQDAAELAFVRRLGGEE